MEKSIANTIEYAYFVNLWHVVFHIHTYRKAGMCTCICICGGGDAWPVFTLILMDQIL